MEVHKLDSSVLRKIVSESHEHAQLEKLLKTKLDEALGKVSLGSSGSASSSSGLQPVPPEQPGDAEKEAEETEEAGRGKRRRGKKRNRPGSNDRRWKALEEAAGPP